MAMFIPATRRKLKLRMAICSPAGYGKSWTGLEFAQTLARLANTKIAAIDTEHGALSKYQGYIFNGMPPVEFDVCELQHFAPSAYTACIREAGAAGYGVILIDSLSHAWAGVGGALAQVDQKAASGGNSFTAWKDVTPQHNELVEAILAYPGHVIATMRTKMEYVLEEETRGSRKVAVPKKIGMKPVQREGMDYEFDIVADMDESHTLIVGKTRCPAIDGQRVVKPGSEFLAPIIRWLDEGAEPAAVKPVFLPSTPPQAHTSTTAIWPTLASDLQISEIIVALNVLGLPGQPAGMLKKRSAARLEDLTRAQADNILGTLRAKVVAKKLELDKQIMEAEKTSKKPDPTATGKPSSAGATSAPNAGEFLSEPELPPQDSSEPVPEFPDRVGSIQEVDQKRILAAAKKLQFSDEDLKRILAKRMTNGNPPSPVRCVPDLSHAQAQEMLVKLREAVHTRFPDSAPF